MTDLRSALERYLSMRKGLGYKYQHQARSLARQSIATPRSDTDRVVASPTP